MNGFSFIENKFILFLTEHLPLDLFFILVSLNKIFTIATW